MVLKAGELQFMGSLARELQPMRPDPIEPSPIEHSQKFPSSKILEIRPSSEPGTSPRPVREARRLRGVPRLRRRGNFQNFTASKEISRVFGHLIYDFNY